MTKYHWEAELRKNLRTLDENEKTEIFEYYDELFADMFENGRSEESIIAEFGNPFDVANKILSDYGYENNRTDNQSIKHYEPSTPKKQSKDEAINSNADYDMDAYSEMNNDYQDSSEKSVKRKRRFNFFKSLALLIPAIVLAVLIFALGAALISGALSLAVTSVAMIVAGVAEFIISFFNYATSIGAAVVATGIGLVAIGIGIITIPHTFKLTKFICKTVPKWLKGFFIGMFTSRLRGER